MRRVARGSRVTAPALVIAYGAASVAVPARGAGSPTTYGATSAWAEGVDVTAGLALILAGCLASLRRRGSLATVTLLAGVVWLAPRWAGWEDGPPAARSLAMLAAPFLLPLLVHAVLAMPAGRVATSAGRLVVSLAYLAATVVSVGRAVTRDPFLDPYCWSNCTDNVLLVRADQEVARALDAFWLRFSVGVGLLVVAFAVWRLLRATHAGRSLLLPVLAPAALALAAEAAYAVALLRDPSEDPRSAVFLAAFLARGIALASLAAGVAWSVVRGLRTSTAISRLAAELGEAPRPGSLRSALAKSLGDRDVDVAYWLSGSRRYVDAGGRPVDAAADRGRAATAIVRSGKPVALVLHDRVLSGTRELEREIGAAARLAVDNERLRAEVLAQLEDLRASRARVVETADAARRRLERDLHDGAQQRLLALSFDLRLAHAAADAAGDREAAALLQEATAEAQAALEELRELAHGIYPAVLGESGLAAALATLADAAPLPVELGDAPRSRYAPEVETAAYVAVADAIADAAARGATYATASAVQQGSLLVVGVEDDGAPRSSPMTHVADRVGAVGGRLTLEPRRVLAELPCV